MWNRTGFKGFTVVRGKNGSARYRVQLRHDGAKIHVGYFDSPEEAARAYDAKIVELRGEFARLNFAASKNKAHLKKLTGKTNGRVM